MADDADAPESWESANLEESIKRLMVSNRAPQVLRPPESSDQTLLNAAAAGVGVGRGNGLTAEAIDQVDQFLREALQNPRERLSVLRMEQEVEKFIRDPRQQELEFQQLPTSYQRLAAHRVAQHYCLQSVVVMDNNSIDGQGSKIVLKKASSVCRLPLIRLADIPVSMPQEEKQNVVKVAIKQRPQKNVHNGSGESSNSSKENQLKSVEERKEEYNRARARIFSLSNNGNSLSTSEGELSVSDNFPQRSLNSSATMLEESSFVDETEVPFGRGIIEPSLNSVRSSRIRSDRETTISRQKSGSRVAIFRDRELERKDPDFDRSYDRYAQRFDPGFGFSGGTYAMQPLYSPAINYNTEFPQLGSAVHRPQVPMEPAPRTVPQQIHGPWSTNPSLVAVNYGHPDGLMPGYNSTLTGVHSSSSIYAPSSQYAHPGMQFIHSQDSIQTPFSQSNEQQSESSFGLARPR